MTYVIRGMMFAKHSVYQHCFTLKPFIMLRWAIVFFIIALVAAIFGFGGIAAGAVGIAKILFFIFLVLFLVSLIGGLMRR